jgi:hypothetical protein
MLLIRSFRRVCERSLQPDNRLHEAVRARHVDQMSGRRRSIATAAVVESTRALENFELEVLPYACIIRSIQARS